MPFKELAEMALAGFFVGIGFGTAVTLFQFLGSYLGG
jgi:hypothetical protein